MNNRELKVRIDSRAAQFVSYRSPMANDPTAGP
jgi:hypothetical protein